MKDRILLTEAQAAERLSLCTRTLREARKDGRLHYVLIGRAVRYTIDDLESFVEANRRINPPCPAKPPAPRTTRRPRKGATIIPFTARNAAG